MNGRTFSEHIAHLEDIATLKPGDRVRVTISGRTGVVVKRNYKRTGWLIRWDEPVFGVTEGRVVGANLERA